MSFQKSYRSVLTAIVCGLFFLVPSLADAGILVAPPTKMEALIAAIEAANAHPGYDKIVLSHESYTVEEAYGDTDNAFPEITSDVELVSESQALIEMAPGAPQLRFFNVGRGGVLRLTHVTLEGGNSGGSGGAIRNEGTLVLERCRLFSNTAYGGGAIWNDGSLSATDVHFVENSTYFTDGGAVVNAANAVFTRTVFWKNHTNRGGGAVANGGYVLAVNTTFSGNTANVHGGAISNGGDLWLKNATAKDNTCDYDHSGGGNGGGISNGGDAHLLNTIVAGNWDTGNESPDVSGEIHSRGYNLIEDLTGGTLVGDAATCIVGVDPVLTPIASDGETLYHRPLNGSPAIDAGSPGSVADTLACEDTDQTGYERPADGDSNGYKACDIGAYEVRGPEYPTDVDDFQVEEERPDVPDGPDGLTTHDPTHGPGRPSDEGKTPVDLGTGRFLRGDANTDGAVDVADASRIMGWLFLGNDAPSCERTADANGDNEVTITDVTKLLNFLFLGGTAPVAPFPQCGTEQTRALLSCASYDACPTPAPVLSRGGSARK